MIVTCQHVQCGMPFDIRPAMLNHGKGKYCSRKCYHAQTELNERETIQAQNAAIVEHWGKMPLLELAVMAGLSFHALRKRLSKLRSEGVMLPHKRKIDVEKKKMEKVRAAKVPKTKPMPLAEKPKVKKQRTVSEKMPNLLKLKGSDAVFIHPREKEKVSFRIDHRNMCFCFPHELAEKKAKYGVA